MSYTLFVFYVLRSPIAYYAFYGVFATYRYTRQITR